MEHTPPQRGAKATPVSPRGNALSSFDDRTRFIGAETDPSLEQQTSPPNPGNHTNFPNTSTVTTLQPEPVASPRFHSRLASYLLSPSTPFLHRLAAGRALFQRDSDCPHSQISFVYASNSRPGPFNPSRHPSRRNLSAQFHTTLRQGCKALTAPPNMDSDVESVVSSFQDESDDFSPMVSPGTRASQRSSRRARRSLCPHPPCSLLSSSS